MIKFVMYNKVFHNNKLLNNNSKIRNFSNQKTKNKELTVDINKLLNRVKINQQHEKKLQIIFSGLAILIVSLMSLFILFT
ncbi:hypothetical protein N8Z07_04380 [Pelagibacteraceae bacterium]|nr:hypothetical protein [Pelagibacteraceae bacterium]